MEIIGKIKKIFDKQTKGSFNFREIVITTNEQYPQNIIIQFVQDKIELLDLYQCGDEVKISINIRGREWTNPQGEIKYFNTISGWRIEKLNNFSSTNINKEEFIPSSSSFNIQDEDDDLPF